MTSIAGRGITAAELLAAVEKFCRRFVVYPSEHALIAHVLWVVHAHFMDAWENTPRLAFLSPEPESGKSRALEITESLVPRPVATVNVSPAYLIRKVCDKAGRPTILLDEIDTIFGPKAKENEEIRGLLNAGHRKGAKSGRCVVRGKGRIETEDFEAYAAVAVAGLGSLPETILSRSVVVRMRKRAPHEHVEQFRQRIHRPEGEALREDLAIWATRQSPVWPHMPPEITDRDADMWEPLLAVANLGGGDWPRRARVAAVALVAASKESSPSLGVRLLADIKVAFGEDAQLATTELIDRLCASEDAPWSDLHGQKLSPLRLSRMLGGYGIAPATIRIGEKTPKGYRRADFHDAWSRYLLTVGGSPHETATSATGATLAVVQGEA